MRQGHLHSASPRYQAGVHHDITGHIHGILEVTLHLIEDVLAGSPQQDGAGLWGFALGEECEVSVTANPTHSQYMGVMLLNTRGVCLRYRLSVVKQP